jgi:hypothetical protein
MPIDLTQLEVGDQFFYPEGVIGPMTQVYVGRFQDRYDFQTFLSGVLAGSGSYTSEQMARDEVECIKIDSNHPEYIEGASNPSQNGMMAFTKVLNDLQTREDNGEELSEQEIFGTLMRDMGQAMLDTPEENQD